jgi:hypothetical protein
MELQASTAQPTLEAIALWRLHLTLPFDTTLY